MMAEEYNKRTTQYPLRPEFDRNSGSILERTIFNNRILLISIWLVFTIGLGWQSTKLSVNASFAEMLPGTQPFIVNYIKNIASLRGLGNSIRVVVENRQGDIYDAAYLDKLRRINDAIFLMKGVDRSYMKSLWTPLVRWTEITEEGTRGGPVMPPNYSGTAQNIMQLKENIARANIVGSVIANDGKSSVIFVPLLDRDPATGAPLDYAKFSHGLEDEVRSLQSDRIGIHIVGFAKLAGDLIDGLLEVMSFFAIAAGIAGCFIFLFTRCPRSTFVILSCSLIAVVWQLGLIELVGYVINPYSVLVPFLVFAIGVSHGAQKMNGIMQDIGRGMHRYVAARYTFRRLFLAGASALLADAVGFAVLYIINIPVIRELAVSASIGVTVLIFTNLILLPVLLSYTGVSRRAALRSIQEQREGSSSLIETWSRRLERCTERRWAASILVVCAVVTLIGGVVGSNLKVGDLDPGAPELRPHSRYNTDNAYIDSHYGLSSDQFAVIVQAPPTGIATYRAMIEMDRLEQEFRELPSVQTTVSAASLSRVFTSFEFEGDPKWMSINRNRFVLGDALNNVYVTNPELVNTDYTIAPVVVYLKDHRAETLSSAVKVAQAFAADHNEPDLKFLLAAGSAGIEAATNIVVEEASNQMLCLVYISVIIICMVAFRSVRAVFVAVIPLAMTSILCQALMVVLGIGIKVATLPVVALGVGIGVDYALYLLSVQLTLQRSGMPLREAYGQSVRSTGKIVALVGVTLAAGVVLWVFSPIKFQADMGVLLAFMFLWNMIGALVIVPALSHFLLSTSPAAITRNARRSRHALAESRCS